MRVNADRVILARQRNRLSGKALAELAGVSAVTISKIENGHQPDDGVIDCIAAALGYPRAFFFMESPQVLEADTVSFRSLKKMSAAERDASLAAGALGVALYDWIDDKFDLASPDLIDLSKERNRPETAARLLRQHWKLGDRPIGNMLKLLESKGIRILSLCENTRNVDAYSFWRADRPYIFLNQEKTAERSLFDSAHELAHLVLHHHAGAKNEKGAEMQADRFASAFLMPAADVLSNVSEIMTASQIIRAKRRWKVSAMALAHRLHDLSMLSDWTYRAICIELGVLGYRSGEPSGVERETSTALAKVLSALWSRRMTKDTIARDLAVPLREIESLIFRLAGPSNANGVRQPLTLVEDGRQS
jgi:Zn-dependent peptidase ImmA (M78 family)/DNA-binding XRE family transcriptional regulator